MKIEYTVDEFISVIRRRFRRAEQEVAGNTMLTLEFFGKDGETPVDVDAIVVRIKQVEEKEQPKPVYTEGIK